MLIWTRKKQRLGFNLPCSSISYQAFHASTLIKIIPKEFSRGFVTFSRTALNSTKFNYLKLIKPLCNILHYSNNWGAYRGVPLRFSIISCKPIALLFKAILNTLILISMHNISNQTRAIFSGLEYKQAPPEKRCLLVKKTCSYVSPRMQRNLLLIPFVINNYDSVLI